MKKVLILFGGVSEEHDVSCVSASYVLANIPRKKYEVLTLGITKQGEWLLYEGEIRLLPDDRWAESGRCVKAVLSPDRSDGGLLVLRPDGTEKIRIDVCFPVLHGKNGEDGTVQGLLELAGIPYVGCGVLSSAVCMDKAVTHTLADAAGIRQTRWLAVTRGEYEKDADGFLKEAVLKLGRPVFVKPANAGSSVGISRAADEKELRAAIDKAFRYDKKLVLEAFVDGYEVECAVLGDAEGLLASDAGQILPCNEFYDYEAKYFGDSRLLIPAELPPEKRNEVRAAALKAFRALGCSGLARADFFVRRDTGEVVFNEINTIPGFTSISMYPKLMAHGGVPYPELLDRLLRLALRKSGGKERN